MQLCEELEADNLDLKEEVEKLQKGNNDLKGPLISGAGAEKTSRMTMALG